MKGFIMRILSLFILCVTSSASASYNSLLSRANTNPGKIGLQFESRFEAAGLANPCTHPFGRMTFDEFIMNENGYLINFGFRAMPDRALDFIPVSCLGLTLQFGRYFQPFGIRFGIKEGGLGAGIDFVHSFKYAEFVSSLDALFYENHSFNRDIFLQSQPLLKWTNKCYVCNHIVLTAGIDHYNHTTAGFLGVGVNF